ERLAVGESDTPVLEIGGHGLDLEAAEPAPIHRATTLIVLDLVHPCHIVMRRHQTCLTSCAAPSRLAPGRILVSHRRLRTIRAAPPQLRPVAGDSPGLGSGIIVRAPYRAQPTPVSVA